MSVKIINIQKHHTKLDICGLRPFGRTVRETLKQSIFEGGANFQVAQKTFYLRP